jgi:uncharacterized repeat protein (TIGR03803 family)
MTCRQFAFASTLVSAVSIAVWVLSGATLAGAQTEALLHSFQLDSATDGANPYGGLAADGKGALYGTTYFGGTFGPYGYGTVYKLSPPAAEGSLWKQHILYSFAGGPDGKYPSGRLLINAKSGRIYGTTQSGGLVNWGVVYELAPAAHSASGWTQTVLYSFDGSTDGGNPFAGVIFDNHGALYGTTSAGGLYGRGVIFRLSPPSLPGGAWAEKVLYSFKGGNDGNQPFGDLIFDSTGALYGTTQRGGGTGCGSWGCGTAFKLSPPSIKGRPWSETVLYAFAGGTDGGFPFSGLVFDNAGALYGAAEYYGQYGWGTVFKLAPPRRKVAPGRRASFIRSRAAATAPFPWLA